MCLVNCSGSMYYCDCYPPSLPLPLPSLSHTMVLPLFLSISPLSQRIVTTLMRKESSVSIRPRKTLNCVCTFLSSRTRFWRTQSHSLWRLGRWTVWGTTSESRQYTSLSMTMRVSVKFTHCRTCSSECKICSECKVRTSVLVASNAYM